MPHNVENDHVPANIIADSVVTNSIPPLTDLGSGQFLAAMRVRSDAVERFEHLSLNSLGELPEVVLEPFGRDEAERRHLAGSGVDRPQCVQAADLPSLVLAGRLLESPLERLIPLLCSNF